MASPAPTRSSSPAANNFITFNNATSGLVGDVSLTGTLTFNQPTDTAVGASHLRDRSVIKTGAGALTLSGTNTYRAAPRSGRHGRNHRQQQSRQRGRRAHFNGGTLRVSPEAAPLRWRRTITLQAGGGTIEAAVITILTGDISGAGGLTKTGIHGLSLTGTNTYHGATNVMTRLLAVGQQVRFRGERLHVAATPLSNSRNQPEHRFARRRRHGVEQQVISAGVLTTGSDNTSTTFSGTLENQAAAPCRSIKVGTGTLTLSGVNTYTGATNVNGGTLVVNGSYRDRRR